jgi:hypothetical protein
MASERFSNDSCNYSKYLQQSTDPFQYSTNLFAQNHQNILANKNYQTVCDTVTKENELRLPNNTNLCHVAKRLTHEFGAINSSVYRNPEYDAEKTRFTHPLDVYKELSIGIPRMYINSYKPQAGDSYAWIPLNSSLYHRDRYDPLKPCRSLKNVSFKNTLDRPGLNKYINKCD